MYIYMIYNVIMKAICSNGFIYTGYVVTDALGTSSAQVH